MSYAEEFIANPRKSPVLTAWYHSDGLNTSLYTPCSPNKNNPTHDVIASISVSNGYLRYALLKPCNYCPSSARQCRLEALTCSVPPSICPVLCLPAYSFPWGPICPSSIYSFIFMELALGCGLPVAIWAILGRKPFLLPITKMFRTVVSSECSLLLLLRDHRPPYPP